MGGRTQTLCHPVPVSWVLAFLGFSVLIVLHEFGHFVAAKAVGMRVERFSLFFGPLLVKWRRGETEYGIGPIPLGGYVKISGMDPREELPEEVAHRAYFRQAAWKRIVVIAAGPAVNIVLAVVVMTGYYALHGQAAVSPVVDSISANSPAAASPLRPGDRILSIDGKTPPAVRGADPEAKARASADQVTALGDVVRGLRCDGRVRVGCAARKPVAIAYERNGRRATTTVTPRVSNAGGVQAMRIGVVWDSTSRSFRYGAAPAVGQAVDTLANVTSKTATTLSKLVYSSKARSEVSGPVGSYDATRQAFEFSPAQAIFLLGIISLSLGVINLLPFLPLDGGHIFWALAEKIRGKPIAFSVLERASIVGVVLVVGIFFLGLRNDVGNIIDGTNQLR